MHDHSFHRTYGILQFGGISFGVAICSILVWLLIMQNASVTKIDESLQQEVQKIDVLLKILAPHHVSTSLIPTEIAQLYSDQRTISLEIQKLSGNQYLRIGSLDSAFFSLVRISSIQPITIPSKGIQYRTYSQQFNGYSICVAVPAPTLWNLMRENYSSPSVLFPLLIILLSGIGMWNFFRLHEPIRRLDQYLQTLVLHPLGNELLKPPAPPKGDVDQLTQTVSKVVERLHSSRNQALQFSSFATHELRTPLTIIRSQLESALASRSKAKEIRCVVASVYDEMLRLSRTVEDLLSLGTMQAGTLTLNTETVSLPKFLSLFYDEALFLTRPKDISVVLKKGPEVSVKVDIIRFRQVFFNLLDNAIKNTPSGNRIRLSYGIKDNKVVIVFADTGTGIAQDKLRKIFEPFYTDGQKKGNHQGAGLGLALVKWIIELHEGNIMVQSEIDKGTEFIITLPCEQAAETT